MLQSNPKEQNYDLKSRRQLNVYRDSLVKTITLVSVSVKTISFLYLGSNNNNNRLVAVISPPDLKKGHRNKSAVSIKIISFLFLNISVNNKRLDVQVHNNILFKLEEKTKS